MAPAGCPGVVVDHLPAATRQYVGSPSIALLPGGELVVTHDLFGPGTTNDTTVVYRSLDRGATWARLAEVRGQWWSTLFWHGGALYLMGASRQYGSVVIRRSLDGGGNWTAPVDADSGLLLDDGRYHCAPVPVLVHAGRIWRAMEDAGGPGGWGHHFRAFMMSAPVDAALLRAANWTCTNRLERDPAWLEGAFGGWLEGNAVVTPSGGVVDVLRVDVPPRAEVAAVIEVSADGTRATFDPATGFVPLPGGAKKFTIRQDPLGGGAGGPYWTLANPVLPAHREEYPGKVRNALALLRSPDLRRWEQRAVLLHHPDVEFHGFQYVDWLFAGEDLLAASRTAFDDGLGGAHNQHDANLLTFHRFAGFRRLGEAEGGAT